MNLKRAIKIGFQASQISVVAASILFFFLVALYDAGAGVFLNPAHVLAGGLSFAFYSWPIVTVIGVTVAPTLIACDKVRLPRWLQTLLGGTLGVILSQVYYLALTLAFSEQSLADAMYPPEALIFHAVAGVIYGSVFAAAAHYLKYRPQTAEPSNNFTT